MSKLKPNIDTSLYKIDSEHLSLSKRMRDVKPVPLEQIIKEFDAFENIDMNSAKHQTVLLELFPSYLLEECDSADWKLFESMSRFDRRNNTFVTGCFDNQLLELKSLSYKWRFKDGIKWKTRAGTSPNGTLFIRIFTDNETVYVVEGHRDSLTSVLLGLDFIMIPYAGFKLKDTESLMQEITGRKVVFIIEDKPAFKCMVEIAKAIEPVAKDIVMLQLQEGDKMDLSDYVFTKNSIKEVLNGLKDKESH